MWRLVPVPPVMVPLASQVTFVNVQNFSVNVKAAAGDDNKESSSSAHSSKGGRHLGGLMTKEKKGREVLSHTCSLIEQKGRERAVIYGN